MWGITNAFLEGPAKREGSFFDMVLDISFILPFGINQLCSVGLNLILGRIEISLALTIVNCVCFIFTYLSQKVLQGDYKLEKRFMIGTVLVVAGLWIALQDKF
ncbi:unnamed protein product [Moneuplotes crassus]|uniref:Uncharacterized protein n=1 Tax=Euplotes crassus TaxID=5936 RepID=A0AAD1Y7A9_EUPCR|nr:unnamed protein product [Moneuplotes crassus]